MVSHTSYSPVHQYGAEDKGMLYPRRVQMPALPYSKAYPTRDSNYLRERVLRHEIEKIIDALTRPLETRERDPYSVTEFQRDPDAYIGKYTTLPAYAETDFPNKTYPSNRYPQSSKTSGTADSWNALVGDDQPDVISFTGPSERDCYEQFFNYAQDYLFGDGLPLVPPTRELVDEMLAATTRKPDEVVGGKFMMRKGVPTVEKVAINAVMAGAKPEYFPIILAAVEGYSMDLEDRGNYFHGTTAGTAYAYLIAVSGAIADEIGMNSGTGYFGAGNDANNTIGRAFRLCIRNLTHNWVPYIDTIRLGRYNDTTCFVVAENEAAVPAGWNTYREQLGWDKNQNCVTVSAFLVSLVNKWTFAGQQENNWGIQDDWTPASIISGVRNASYKSATLPQHDIITPAMAEAFADAGFTDVTLRYNNNTGVTGYPNGFGSSNTGQNFILVAGDDPGYCLSFNSATHDNGATCKATLITGATLTLAGRDPAPPAVPKNFTVVPGANPGEAVLSWNEPDTTGRAAITGYEVTAQIQDYERWVTVPGGAGARTVTLTHLDGGAPYTFRVRAIAGEYNRGSSMFCFGGRRVPAVSGTPTGTGSNATTTNVYTN
ncbi:MAG: fibronectin type III domain-containing protein, partial [Oscillospiraceae bacterium]|nr:fibronectin type III domain-containing protein [Oscillospiraceae bacterium]